MAEDRNRIYNLSIYLLKDSIKNLRGALKSVDYEEYKIKKQFNMEGSIFIGLNKSKDANWQLLLQEAIEEPIPKIESTSNRALMIIKIEKRFYALPFGYGKHMLKEGTIDRNIALKTALNIINSDSLRSLDRANLNNLSMFTKTQSSTSTGQESFNIDPIKDLLKGVTGGVDTDKKILGNNLTGNDGLYINPSITFKDIKPILKLIEVATSSNKYTENFNWIDNLKQEKDPTTIEILKTLLLDDLILKDQVKIVLAPYMIIDWDHFEGVSYTERGNLQQDFSIEAFYNVNRRDIIKDWEHFQRFKIYFKFSNWENAKVVPLWRCLNYEVKYKDFLFVLMDGIWYKINEKYSNDIREYALQFEESKLAFIDCDTDMDEDEYNRALARSNLSYGLLDKKFVKSDFVRSKIELCDVLSNSKELVHVKFYRDSTGLSHLFSQGRISANLLWRDKTFRKNVRRKLNGLGMDQDLFPLEFKDFNRADYTITFAIIDNKERSFVDTLPFFSLLNFRLVAEELVGWGFNVRVKKIDII